MKVLLRSTFICEPTDSKDLFLQNFLLLQESGLEFDVVEDHVIYTAIRDFVQAHNHVPELLTLREHFKRKNLTECWNRIDNIYTQTALVQGDFANRVDSLVKERQKRLWAEILKEAAIITSTGMEVGKGEDKKILLGPQDAARYVMERSQTVVAPTLTTRLSGEILADGQDFLKEYARIEADPLAGVGQHCGIEQIDAATGGAKRFELWIHAAFTGGMKSTFALNWVYNQAIYYKHNSLYFSLEMPYPQCRRLLYAMHSLHTKFKSVRYALGIQQSPDFNVGLDATKIRDAKLSPAERKFLFEYVVPDLDNKTNGYGQIHIEIADPDKMDYTVLDMRSKAEMLYAKSPFSMIAVDHAGLMSSRKSRKNTTEELNEVIRDLKRTSMSFNRGRGIAVLALFQISRSGYAAAKKKKDTTGIAGYDLTHLSYANEAERSGDIITASWIDEEFQEKNRVQFQCLKSRDQAPFKPFLGRVEWPCRRILTCLDALTPTPQDGKPKDFKQAEQQLDDK